MYEVVSSPLQSLPDAATKKGHSHQTFPSPSHHHHHRQPFALQASVHDDHHDDRHDHSQDSGLLLPDNPQKRFFFRNRDTFPSPH